MNEMVIREKGNERPGMLQHGIKRKRAFLTAQLGSLGNLPSGQLAFWPTMAMLGHP
jgi:hypothetical protein